jgi:hypothetical protein
MNKATATPKSQQLAQVASWQYHVTSNMQISNAASMLMTMHSFCTHTHMLMSKQTSKKSIFSFQLTMEMSSLWLEHSKTTVMSGA